MGSEWRRTEWGELATLEYGGLSREQYADSGRYRAYGTNGPVGWTDRAEVDGPGVVIGRKGAYRGIHWSPRPFGVIGTAFYLRPKVPLDLKWAYYQLLTQDINGMDSGSAIPSTSRYDFYRLPVRVPPLEEQSAIAAALGALDDKIDLNRRMSRTLDAIAQAIFKSWFLDPVDGGLPAGWSTLAVADVAVLNAHTLTAKDDLAGLQYVEIAAVDHGTVSGAPFYAREEAPQRARRRLRHGDTVLSTVRPDRGAYFLVVDPPVNLVASTGFVTLTAVAVPWAFLHSAMTLPAVLGRLGRLADGGAYPVVSPELVGNQTIPIPRDVARMEEYQAIAEPLYRRSSELRAEALKLGGVRESLLPRLMSGDLRPFAAAGSVER